VARASSASLQRRVRSSPSGVAPAATRSTTASSQGGGTGGSDVGGGRIGVDRDVAISEEPGAGLSRTQADIASVVASTTPVAMGNVRRDPARLMINRPLRAYEVLGSRPL
jgi:hypothetical protein